MRETAPTQVREREICSHCRDDCAATPVYADEKVFCCTGCRSVYELLYANNLCTYYNLDESLRPGLPDSFTGLVFFIGLKPPDP